jgi:uncharacterized protein YigA (DUF484 family)
MLNQWRVASKEVASLTQWNMWNQREAIEELDKALNRFTNYKKSDHNYMIT